MSWYRDAVIYELHVRTFADSNGDGIGDFSGLTARLDYLQDLGVTALWLLPFYPSPRRDEGYDIADYCNVHADYGTLRDFRRFVDESHRRGLRVITEIVLNHTSDQHSWFERARRAPFGSPERDWYVWSDDPGRWPLARVIFQDFEHSNWTWDPIAKSYYWHRFYSHQPDLNFDHPPVRREMLRTIEYWLELGVDGLRLDAIPYLFERDGTTCENLGETHDFLREVRALVDARFSDRMLLAEANQWPEDAAAYFGAGDECHMAFHFPLMPRLFMALRMEDRFPVTDVLRQTPDPPTGCQWAIFLRNHDELTLEMVTDEERDYMWRTYAHEPAMRVNVGIRRRLAPLLANHRPRLELMNGLLCSLPGTPVLYYGDEIGMGDNVYLGDRDAVRTPMQWSGDRNAGFSRTNPQRLTLPVIIDPEFHYETVNVEAQASNPDSLLWWVRRLLAIRHRHPALSRGSLQLLSPSNPRVLAFVRQPRDETDGSPLLVVANLSRYAQFVGLDLSEFRGRTPIELFGQTRFPPIAELPYLLTLGPHAFYWFSLPPVVIAADHRGRDVPELTCSRRWTSVLERPARDAFERVLPDVLAPRRWFGAPRRAIARVAVDDDIAMALPGRWERGDAPDLQARLLVLRVEPLEGEPEHYLLPITFIADDELDGHLADQPDAVLTRLRVDMPADRVRCGVLVDAHAVPGFGLALCDLLTKRRVLKGRHGTVAGGLADRSALAGDDLPAPTPINTDQSNTSLQFDRRLTMKTVRRVETGESPEAELGRVLSRSGFRNAAPLVGVVDYWRDRAAATIAVLHRYVEHECDGFDWFRSGAVRFLHAELTSESGEHADETTADVLPAARLLGRRTGEMHLALSHDRDREELAPEPIGPLARRSQYQSMRVTARRALAVLRSALPDLPPEVISAAEAILGSEALILDRLQSVLTVEDAVRIRVHGYLHLGQVLMTGDDFVIIDFEGEPSRPLGERRIKRSPLRDVAGMVRSFHYAAATADANLVARGDADLHDAPERLFLARFRWSERVASEFLVGYCDAVDESGLLPVDPAAVARLLDAHLLEKNLYEVTYELSHRPGWINVPLDGLRVQLGLALPT